MYTSISFVRQVVVVVVGGKRQYLHHTSNLVCHAHGSSVGICDGLLYSSREELPRTDRYENHSFKNWSTVIENSFGKTKEFIDLNKEKQNELWDIPLQYLILFLQYQQLCMYYSISYFIPCWCVEPTLS